MLTRTQAPRLFATVLLLGSLACAAPLYAQDAAMSPSAATDNTSSTTAPAVNNGASMSGDTSATSDTPTKTWHHKGHGKEDMGQRVEERIKTLHAKLNITPDQESAWGGVAQAMRDSETNISSLIKARHENSSKMTAVDDLQSYQKIAQAHADGLGKVASAFSTLYNSMSDTQKANADKVFSGFGGHMHGGHHHGMKPAAQ